VVSGRTRRFVGVLDVVPGGPWLSILSYLV
jgi:hypothetical protein